MTNSFGITPQRQIREQVARPEAPTELAAPATPAQEPQQVGGQLLDMRNYVPDTRGQETIQKIASFLQDQGVFDRSIDMMREDYIKKKKRQAEDLIEKEATALSDTAELGQEAEELKRRKQFEAARETQLRNPYVNFFYYGNKATEAGNQIAIDLAAWGQDSAESLSYMEDPADRSVAITQKANELKKAYANLPADYVAAKIDPLIAQTKVEINKLVAKEQVKRKDETRITGLAEVVRDSLITSSKLSQQGGKTGLTIGDQAVEVALGKFFESATGQYLMDERTANKILFDVLPEVFIDLDGDQENDLASQLTYRSYLEALGKVKTSDGVNLLDLVQTNAQGKRTTLREALQAGLLNQMQVYNKIEQAGTKELQGIKAEYILNRDRSIKEWYSGNPNPSNDDIAAKRNELLEQLDPATLPDGLNVTDARKAIEKMLPSVERKLSDNEKLGFSKTVNALIASGVVQMPEDLEEQLTGTDFYYDAKKKFQEAEIKFLNPDIDKFSEDILDDLVNGVAQNILDKDTLVKALVNRERGQVPEQVKAAQKEAARRLRAEAYNDVRARLAALTPEQFANPAERNKVLSELQTDYYNREAYSKAGSYFNYVGTQYMDPKVPYLGTSNYNPTTGWDIKLNDTDNGGAWSISARTQFANDADKARTYMKERIMFTQDQFGELYKALQTGNTKGLSIETRQRVRNYMYAFDHQITPAQLINTQLERFVTEGGGKMPPTSKAFNDSLNRLGKSVMSPVAQTGDKASDLQLSRGDNDHEHSGNNGFDFTIHRGNYVQTRNQMPAPFSGKVVYAKKVPGFGNTLIIEAEDDGPGYKAGDRLLVGHSSVMLHKEGDQVYAGQALVIAGDKSPMNSVPGMSGTGKGAPGHLHGQLLKKPVDGWPGPWVDQREHDYPQQQQNEFFKLNVIPLFK